MEGRSYFKCNYGRKHLDEEYTEQEDEEGEFNFSKDKKEKEGCKNCVAQIKDKQFLEEVYHPPKHLWEGLVDMDFKQLVFELMPMPKKNSKEKMVSGCEVFFPHTLFFENGKPSFIAQNDKDYCMQKLNDGDSNSKFTNPNDLV